MQGMMGKDGTHGNVHKQKFTRMTVGVDAGVGRCGSRWLVGRFITSQRHIEMDETTY